MRGRWHCQAVSHDGRQKEPLATPLRRKHEVWPGRGQPERPTLTSEMTQHGGQVKPNQPVTGTFEQPKISKVVPERSSPCTRITPASQ